MASTFDRSVSAVLTLLSLAYIVAALQAFKMPLCLLLSLAAVIQCIATFKLRENPSPVGWRVTILLASDFALFLFSLWTGKSSGFHHFFITLTTLPFMMIPRRDRWALFVSVGVAIGLYLSVEIAGHQLYTPVVEMPVLVTVLYWVLLPFRFLFLLMGASYFAASSEKAQARINLTLSELRESVRTSRALLSAIPDMIFRVSDDGRFLDFHCQSVSDLFASPEKLVGKRLNEVLPEEIAARLFERVREAISHEKGADAESMGVHTFELKRNGVVHTYDTRIASTGAMDVLMVVQDVTERVRAEKTILEQQIKVAAANKMAALGEMAGGIAHEINNPLAIISGRAQELMELAEAGQVEASTVQLIAEKVDQTAMRISKIIRSLRFFARDGQEDPFEEASIAEIIHDTLEFCRQRFMSHAIDLHVRDVPQEISLECRAVQIGQVLLNLLNNSHDAVSSLPEKWIDLSVRDLGDRVEIAVTDSGNGIPMEIRGKILEPFFTTKGVGKGTGLGLSISKGIVESHQGTFYLDEKSEHTRFVMDLPKSQRRAKRPSAVNSDSAKGADQSR